MQNIERPMRPVDRDIGAWAKVLGVFGFVMLLGLFFSLGVFIIGPKLRSAKTEAPPPETTHQYVPPSRPRVEEEQKAEDGPDIQLEVTEQGAGDTPAADENAGGDQAQDGADVKADGNDLTITLDGKDKRRSEDDTVPTATERKRTITTPRPKTVSPEKPAETKPSTSRTKSPEAAKPTPRSTLEKPRAATEKRQVTYRVQAGSYANKSTADGLAAKLRDEGYRRTTVTPAQVNGRTLYRVQVAEYKTSLDAEELSKDLKATGYQPTVMTAEKSH